MTRFRACFLLLPLLATTWSGCTSGDHGEALSPQRLAETTFAGIYDEPVRLHRGRYEGEPFVDGGASRPTV
jgi:hypothetical protein